MKKHNPRSFNPSNAPIFSSKVAQPFSSQLNFSLSKAESLLRHMELEWENFYTRLQNIKEDELDGDDIFTQIDFVERLDEALCSISDELEELREIDEKLDHVNRSNLEQEEKNRLKNFEHELKQVVPLIKRKIEQAADSFEEVEEELLGRCEAKIMNLIDRIERNRRDLSLKDQIDLNLEVEDELKEIRDSLEEYREIHIEHNPGRENDPIVAVLDSLILMCDSALLIDESSL